MLGGERPLPPLLLHLPLVLRDELVGVILADPGSVPDERPTSLLDIAATLGSTAAMAIAHARLHALLLHHRGELQRLSNKGLVVVEDILRRLSRELHDNTCQAPMAIKLDLALLERRFGGEAAGLRGAVDDLRAQLMDVMQSVRQMSHLIYPPVLDDFGAVAAIESTAAKYQEASTLAVRVECSDATMRFSPPVELLLFRVFQEALTNVVKHAGATSVTVRLALEDGGVRLEIQDDGRGFDAHGYFRSPPASAGLGLLGMRERVGHLGGAFRVTSRPRRGTHIVVHVPTMPLAAAKAAG
jgi:two-component system NarL family sensor kinase